MIFGDFLCFFFGDFLLSVGMCFHRKGGASDGFFADSTMGFITIKPPFRRICLELFPTTLSKSKFWGESITANQSGQITATSHDMGPPKR